MDRLINGPFDVGSSELSRLVRKVIKGYQGSNYRSGTYSTHIVDGMAKIKDFSINNWEMQRSVATIRGRDMDNTSFPPPSTHLSGGRGFKPLDHKKNSAQKSSVRMKG